MARNRLFDDDVLVIGLGRFGSAVALELTKLGHRVIAVERNSTLAETYVNKVYRVVHADMAKSAALEMIRAAAPKIAIVGIGSSIESLDYIEFDDGFAIVKVNPPTEAIGFTLEQSAIRRKYGVTVVGVKAPGEDFTYAVPQTKISSHHMLIVSGPTELIERFAARP